MKIRFEGKIITRWQQLLILVLSILLSVCKICYLPLVTLVLFIKKGQYKWGKKEKIIFSILVLGLSVFAVLLWMKSASAILDSVYPNSGLQKEYVLSHPVDYLVTLIRAVITSTVGMVEGLFVGNLMYHAQITIPTIVSMFYAGLVCVAAFMKEKKSKVSLSNIEKIWMGGGCAAVIVLILTALYIQCTAQFGGGIGSSSIAGMQGRYFIPIILCVPFFINRGKFVNINERYIIILAVTTSLIVWMHMIVQFII